jgi:hypothetical protein
LPAGEAAARHLVLLTDGRSGPGNLEELVNRCRESHVSISAIGVGDPQDVDVELLQLIAAGTGGRFHLVQDLTSLPRIMIHEAVTLRRNAIRNGPITPETRIPSQVLKGIDRLPSLQSLVVTLPKDRAEVVLTAPIEGAEKDEDPVLALSRHGIGRTAAFTSDLSSKWGQEWLSWDHYDAFVKQLLTEISRSRKEHHLRVNGFADGDEGVIQVDDLAPETGLHDVWAVVQGLDHKSQQLQLTQVGARRYQARFPLQGQGRYLLTAITDDDRVSGGFVVPYSQEYLRFHANPLVLKQIARTTGGRVLTGNETHEDLYPTDRPFRLSTSSIAELLLILSALALPLDVAIRRVRIDLRDLRNWFYQPEADRSPTIDALLWRKQSVSRSLPERRDSTAMNAAVPPWRPPSRSSTASTATRPEPPIQAEETSTTSRLLAAMNRERHRNQDRK